MSWNARKYRWYNHRLFSPVQWDHLGLCTWRKERSNSPYRGCSSCDSFSVVSTRKNEEIKYSLESASSLICAGTEISLTRTLGGRFLPHWTRQAISTIVLFQIDAVHNEAAVLVPAWLQIVHSSGWQSGCWFQLNDEFESVSRSSSFLFLLNSFRKMELSGATVKVPFSECTGIYSVYTGIVSVPWSTGNTAIFYSNWYFLIGTRNTGIVFVPVYR